jgi:hypothetical protein
MSMPKFDKYSAIWPKKDVAPGKAPPARSHADRGQGPKTISPTGEKMAGRNVRMTDAEWEKCKRLGGAVWLRAQIQKAES